MSKTLEINVKKDLLTESDLLQYDLKNIFPNTILFEKVLVPAYLRADVSIFTQQGLIGIEIKNKYDSLKRLQRQLIGYFQTCNFVYVECHENHLLGTIQIAKRLQIFQYLGIIKYITWDGIVVPELYKPAKMNPKFNLRACLNILWKNELLRILIANYQHSSYQKSNFGLSFQQMHSGVKRFFNNKHPTKKQIVDKIIYIFGKQKCIQLFNDMFITHDCDPQKPLKYYQFKRDLV